MKKFALLAGFLSLLFIISIPVYAADTSGAASSGGTATFVPLNQSLPGIADFASSPSIPNLLNNIYKIAIGLAAVLAVLQIMRAGVMYMGGDSITEKKQAKDLIATSILGLVLVLTPTIVFSIINPSILTLQIGASSLHTTVAAPDNTSSAATAGQPNSCQSFTEIIAVPDACTAYQDYAPTDSACCSALDKGYSCCGKLTSTAKTLVDSSIKTKVVPLVGKDFGGAGTDPVIACHALAGAQYNPGSSCGPIKTGEACCVIGS